MRRARVENSRKKNTNKVNCKTGNMALEGTKGGALASFNTLRSSVKVKQQPKHSHRITVELRPIAFTTQRNTSANRKIIMRSKSTS